MYSILIPIISIQDNFMFLLIFFFNVKTILQIHNILLEYFLLEHNAFDAFTSLCGVFGFRTLIHQIHIRALKQKYFRNSTDTFFFTTSLVNV